MSGDLKNIHGYFEGEVNTHLPRLYGMAMRLTKNRDEAEDLVAESVAKAWECLGDLKDRGSFRPWVFRILTNTFISGFRKRKREVYLETDPEPIHAGEKPFSIFEKMHQPILLWWSSPEKEFLNKLLRDDLDKAVEALPEDYRIVVVLSEMEGFSYQQMADILNVPIGTIRSRLARGRVMLQKALWRHAEEAGLIRSGKAGEKR